MPTDPGLASDTCIRMKPGDPFWNSPYIRLNAGTTPGKAQQGANTVDVRFDKDPPDCPLGNIGEVIIELWACNPSVANFGPGRGCKLGSTTPTRVDANAVQGAFWNQLTWTVPAPNPSFPNEPLAPGHRCLVARCYPDDFVSSPDSSNFFHRPNGPEDPGDQHCAQLNITICPCSSPCEALNVIAAFPEDHLEIVQIDGRVNFEPPAELEEILVGMLPGEVQIIKDPDRPLPRFVVNLDDFQGVEVVDEEVRGVYRALAVPRFDRETWLTFTMDVDGEDQLVSGEALVVELSTRSLDNDFPLGGMTVVFLGPGFP